VKVGLVAIAFTTTTGGIEVVSRIYAALSGAVIVAG
jgi:glutamate/tyrosine decarboxylase-like PLP-dependent enzyme